MNRREVASVSFHSMLAKSCCRNEALSGSGLVIFRGLHRGIRHAMGHLRDGRHDAVFRVLLMPLLRRVKVRRDAGGEQHPRQRDCRDPVRLACTS